MAQLFGNTNVIQIMLLIRHMLNIVTQLPVTTTIDHKTELKKEFTEAQQEQFLVIILMLYLAQ